MALETILTERTLSFSHNSSYGLFMCNIGSLDVLPIEGETYQVIFDGQTFTCKAFVANISTMTVNLGNPAVIGGEDNGVPFVISSNIESGGTSIFTTSQDSTHTVAIYYEELSSKVVLYDRDMNLNSYNIDKGIRLFREDGSSRDFISASPVETDVQLDFSGGDTMEVTPGENELFSKVNIAKPSTLVPEHISKGVNIAGVTGTLKAGGDGVKSKAVNFYDVYGNIVYSYTRAQAAALTELPEVPELEGYEADGWGKSLAKVQSVQAFLDVGARYTKNGVPACIAVIDVLSASTTQMNIHRNDGGSTTTTTAEVDWGDGKTSTVTLTSSTKTASFSHAYSKAGIYVVGIMYSSRAYLEVGGYISGSGTSEVNAFLYKSDATSNMTRLLACSGGFMAANSAFYNQTKLKYLDMDIGTGSCYGCFNLEVNAYNEITSGGSYQLYNCHSLKRYSGRMYSTSTNRQMSSAIIDDFLTSSSSTMYFYSTDIRRIINTSTTVSGFSGTLKTTSLLGIYVPDNLVSSYKSASGWSTYASWIKPLSEYPDY